MQKPMIHWLLHSTGDSHVVFVTLSSRTFVSLPCSPSRPGADHHLKCFSRFSFTALKKTHFNRFTRCGGQITWNLIRVTPGSGRGQLIHTNKDPYFLDCFVSWEIKTSKCRDVSITELNAETLKLQIRVSKFIRLRLATKRRFKKQKRCSGWSGSSQ